MFLATGARRIRWPRAGCGHTSLCAPSLSKKRRTGATHLCTLGFESLNACIAPHGISLDRRAVLGSAYGKLSDRFLKLAKTVLARPHAELALTVDASQAKTIGISVLQLPCVERELLFRFRLEALRALLPIAVIARAGRGFFRQLPLVCRKTSWF